MRRYRLLHTAIGAGWVTAAHDVADGGLAVALAECAIGGRLGARIDLARVPVAPRPASAAGGTNAAAQRRAGLLFSETAGRLLVTVPPAMAARMDDHFRGLPCAAVGEVTGDDRVSVLDGGAPVAAWPVADLVRAWKTPI